MKKLLSIFTTILLMSTTWLNAQDVSPLPSVTIKKLIAPNNPTYYYNTIDSAFWVFKGETGWLRIATNAQLQKYYVPYIGAIKDVDLNTKTIKADGVLFNTGTSTSVTLEGEMRWNATDGTVDLGMSGGNIMQQIGQELFIKVRNASGSTIPNGTPVYFNGRQGNRAKIYPARSDIASTSMVFGITTQDILDNSDGFITPFGYTRQLATNYTGFGIWGTTWDEGDNLYVSKTVAGQLTNVEPTAPHHSDVVGQVAIVGGAGIGSIFVRIDQHRTLEELTDVNGTPLSTSGQFPVWNETNEYFDFDKNINDYVPFTTLTQIKEFSGFINNEAITVAYNHTNRTITLTGDLRYQFLGKQYELTSPWTSSAHTATAGAWFLSSPDGTNFVWSQTPWLFSNVQVSYVNYNASNLLSFATREPHGAAMDHQTHFELHNNIGTYKLASDGGGVATVGTYELNTATDVATTPGFNTAIVYDEDIKQTITALTQGTYTTMYVLNNTSSTFNTASTFPFLSSGSYIQLNNVVTGSLSTGTNLRYYNVYDILLPTASDNDSQKYRHIFLQAQREYNSLNDALLESTSELQYGSLSNIAPEFFVSARITYATLAANGNTGKCTISSITYIIGNKSNQINIAGVTPSNHTLLSNLAWSSSGHNGTANSLAGFDGSGNADYTLKSTYQPVLVYNEQTVSTSGTTTYTVPFTLKSSSLVWYNGTLLNTSNWSGVGTTTLTLILNTEQYDTIKILN